MPVTIMDLYLDYDWSEKWTALDHKAREGSDCKPLLKIHRKLRNTSVWVWTVPNSCEQGLPHTRSVDVIALPKNLPRERISSVMDHEIIHILQRLMPDSWANFYRRKWHYEIYSEPPFGMPEELITNIRANPDTANHPWCRWQSRWWPVPVYKSTENPRLNGTDIRWWDQEHSTISDDPPDDWVKFFGESLHKNEHPHEISAEFLAGPLRNGSIPRSPSIAMKLLRDAWDESLEPTFPSLT